MTSVAATPEASESNFPPVESEVHRELRALITKAGGLLPLSGPITAFAFLNTLQALEDLPFDEGIQRGARLYGCQPYLSEDDYRSKLERGRIRDEDLVAVLRDDLGERGSASVASLTTRFELRHTMLAHRLRQGPAEELRWFVAETDALTHLRSEMTPLAREQFIDETRHWVMRDLRVADSADAAHAPRAKQVLDDLAHRLGNREIEHWSEATWEAFSLQALWRICRSGVEGIESFPSTTFEPLRHRDLLLAVTDEDSDTLVHAVLIRFCAAYCDQGFASWPLPNREQGFYKSFFALYRDGGGPPDAWLRELPHELTRIETAGLGPLDSIVESLSLLGVPPEEHEDFVVSSLLALRGWAGMLWQMETRSDRMPLATTEGTLVEFLAVRLILDRLALAHLVHAQFGFRGPLVRLRGSLRARIVHHEAPQEEQRTFQVFQLGQLLGWSPQKLLDLSRAQWIALVGEIEEFSNFERRRIYHLAFERRFRIQALDAVSIYTWRPAQRVVNPRFQAVFCIDAREESFRRHLEELAPTTETFGAAGFFSVAMYYRGITDAHFAALCPIVVRPLHWVTEEVVTSLAESHRRRANTRRALGTAFHRVHVGSRSVGGGALLAAGLGVLASVPMVARVLFPRIVGRVRRTANSLVEAPRLTRLRLERSTPDPGPVDDQIGFSLAEMANIGERVLRDIGLTSGFARLVMFLGHGSFCLNNPHKSAYDCGACSGSAGGPNGRALAAVLNDPRVREILASRGLQVPADTVFLGGLHNTANDSVTFADLDLLPESHQRDYESARETLEQVCERNAHERCRRFDSAPLDLSFAAAHRHVEGRSEDLAQTRPEFGNATNAMCFVGRRARIRGLYLDRRSFMHSYDATQDDAEQTILARILAAVVPVCEGINMQYFLSYVDSPGWGCGTKLPHNVTSLLGVMDGAASDLRPGLPWQGVEIHEPLRLLFVIESTPEAMQRIMDRNPTVGNILRNGWAQLAVLDPHSANIQLLRGSKFEPYQPEASELPQASTSFEWYRGWRENLGFAAIAR